MTDQQRRCGIALLVREKQMGSGKALCLGIGRGDRAQGGITGAIGRNSSRRTWCRASARSRFVGSHSSVGRIVNA